MERGSLRRRGARSRGPSASRIRTACVAARARERVPPAAEAPELLGIDLVYVGLAGVGILDHPHCLLQGQRKGCPRRPYESRRRARRFFRSCGTVLRQNRDGLWEGGFSGLAVSAPEQMTIVHATTLVGPTSLGRRFTTATLRGHAVLRGQEPRGDATAPPARGGLPGLWFAGPAPDGSDPLWSRPRASLS